MPTGADKPIIFISYAHADEPEKPAEGEIKWLSFVTGYLRPALKLGAVDIWIDRLMPGGADWEREIAAKLRACDIFILLVSRHSLSSDYVVDKEIAIIRERQAKGEDVHFYPLVLTPTPKIALDLVRDKNLRPRDGKPLFSLSINDRFSQMNDVADEIAEIAAEVAQHSSEPASAISAPPAESAAATDQVSPLSDGEPHSAGRPGLSSAWFGGAAERFGLRGEIKHRKSLEVWLRGQSREVSVVIAARAALRAAPFAVRMHQNTLFPTIDLTGVAFRATALARAAGKYPARANEFGAAAAAAAHAAARAAIWEEVRADAAAIIRVGPGAVADAPLWSGDRPDWAIAVWAATRARLPKDDVWIDWYEERLVGGSRGEEYEIVFANVPREEWEEGPATANAWIKQHLPAPTPKQHGVAEIEDQESLETWLKGRSPEVAVVIASRASLRALPLVVYRPQKQGDLDGRRSMPPLISAVFRANAPVWVAANFPDQADEMNASAFAAAEAASTSDAAVVSVAADAAYAAAAFSASSRDPDAGQHAKHHGSRAVARAASLIDSAADSRDAQNSVAWAAIESDIESILSRGVGATDDLPLWPLGAPK
jgi:hypothetical protein